MSSSPSLPIEAPAPRVLGQLAYGALFGIVLPFLLAAWAIVLDRRVQLPAIGSQLGGIVIALAGASIAAAGVIVLRVRGGGWPMSPYPPRRLVTSGIYALVAHPLYLGCVLLAAGVFVSFRSAAGIWIVTPVLAASCIAFVWGSEAERTQALFGARARPLIHLPAASDDMPPLSDRISVCLLALLPWYLVYEGINRLGPWRDAIRVAGAWDAALPVIGWTEVVYFLAYPIVLAAPFVARRRRDLRELVVRAWLATAASAVCYLAVPTSFAKKPVPVTPFAPMLEWERAFDAPNTHLPAFHVIWVVLTMDVYARAFPRTRPWHWPIVIAVAASCVTTGMHAVFDVVAGLLFGWVFLRIERVWRAVARGAEWLSHSRAEWRIGRLRVINHGWYAGLAVTFGAALITALAGEELRAAVVLVAIAAMVSAALWAQWVEGSSSLLRPYGYYGALIGGMAMIAVTGGGMHLLAAYAVAAPFIQSIGRLRCLVQGCCHGRPTIGIGTRVTHPQSRIVKIAYLSGIALHPTAVYSILAGLVVGALLLRLWIAGAPVAFVAGAYLILSSLARFVEEHYRGEPQTRFVAGLRLYQWMSITGVLAGALLTTLPSPAAPAIRPLSLSSVWIALATGAIAFLAYGVDFPTSNRRFARLS
jgi:protein-S-isoprenylcysteine O-methyltransferase Ste14